jgi:hypothetical protein
VRGARKFLDAIDFSNRVSPRIDGGEWLVTPSDEFNFEEVCEINRHPVSHLHMSIGVMDKADFCARLVKEFWLKQIGEDASYTTPFGFFFHVHWTCA